VQRYAALEDAESQAKAESELRIVLKELTEAPKIARARYELARVLEWQGTIERFEDALALYEQSARDAVGEDWSLDAVDRAEVIRELLRKTR
jgi:hypothetical protein